MVLSCRILDAAKYLATSPEEAQKKLDAAKYLATSPEEAKKKAQV